MLPLFVKYRTESGRGYLYDLGTGDILEADDAEYEIVDDYRLLTHDEILRKYKHLDAETVRTALHNLDEIRTENCLADHFPKEPDRVERIYYGNKLYTLEDFWGRTASLLILGITEKCNLCCSYCCYSGKFAGMRPHSNRTMPLEIAQKAVMEYLGDAPPEENDFFPLTFYGGEPLLEFDLVKQVVKFTNEQAKQQGKTIRYSMTTNGTLLGDEATDYMVEHGFMVIVSFDGPKKSHDRYRVFNNGKGSFDVVYQSIKRFAERHPDYQNRGVNMVLAPPLELDEASKFMDEIHEKFPLSRASIVNTGTEYRFMDQPSAPTQYGCYAACCDKPEPSSDDFRNFGEEDRDGLKKYWDACVESLKKHGLQHTKQTLPLATMMFEQQIDLYHRRTVSARKKDWTMIVPCFPGFSRRFCDAAGNYRICERVDDSDTFILGSVQNGLDIDRLHRTMELRRHLGDCGNCTAVKTCDICYARVPNSDDDASGFDPLYDLQCQRTRSTQLVQLRTYTEIMEVNPTAFDLPHAPPTTKRDQLRYGVIQRPLTPEQRERLKWERKESG